MKKSIYHELTTDELIKKRDLLKGVSIGFAIIFMLAIAIVIYIFNSKGIKNVSIATLIPVFTMPVIFVPLLINLNLMNKEIKTRNL